MHCTSLGEGVAPVKKVDMDAVPLINGVPLPEVDIEESILDKPWRKPGRCGLLLSLIRVFGF